MSLAARFIGVDAVVKSTFDANDAVFIVPDVAVFCNIDIVLLPWLLVAMSSLPSPFRSTRTTARGLAPVVKSTFAANEPAVSVPVVLMLRNTEIVLLFTLLTARSGLPSPSMSPMATLYGLTPVVASDF